MKGCILAGGSGTRLWPESREKLPKQFLPLLGEETLFQQTVKRLAQLGIEDISVICNEEHRFLVAEQLRAINIQADILLEKQGRNTGPAVILGVMFHGNQSDDAPVLVVSADHYINDDKKFSTIVNLASEDDHLDTHIGIFGIEPAYPSDQYGYIKTGNNIGNVYSVTAFTEKPSKNEAQTMLEQGSYFWNAGIFQCKPSVLKQQLSSIGLTDVVNSIQAVIDSLKVDNDFKRIDSELYAQLPAIAFDVLVLEKTSQIVMFPMQLQWSDVGSWQGVYGVSDKDEKDNVVKGDVIALDTRNSVLRSHHKLLVAIDVEDLAVVETDDAILVTSMRSSHRAGEIAKQLKREGRSQAEAHREVLRPWGKYDSIDKGERYQVKRITVKPGGLLSLQMHHHRAEHWVVVKGTAKVTNGEKQFLVTENQSTYIPLGETHRLENPGSIPLEMIEVQSGTYLGEDDIVRFNDIYERH